jgi:hypothetical protein
MFKQFLEKVTGVDIYLIISLLIFLSFFIGVAIWLIKVDKKYIDQMKKMPVE